MPYTPEEIKFALLSGMDPDHASNLADYTKENKMLIAIRAPKVNSLKYQETPGYKPKPVTMKFKTDAESGLVKVSRGKDGKLYDADGVQEGFTIDQNGRILKNGKPTEFRMGDDNSVIDKDGNRFFSDYDLMGAYEQIPGTNTMRQTFMGDSMSNSQDLKELNKAVNPKQRMFQHGSNDDYFEWGKVVPGNVVDSNEKYIVADRDGNVFMTDEDGLKKVYELHGIKWAAEQN